MMSMLTFAFSILVDGYVNLKVTEKIHRTSKMYVYFRYQMLLLMEKFKFYSCYIFQVSISS